MSEPASTPFTEEEARVDQDAARVRKWLTSGDALGHEPPTASIARILAYIEQLEARVGPLHSRLAELVAVQGSCRALSGTPDHEEYHGALAAAQRLLDDLDATTEASND